VLRRVCGCVLCVGEANKAVVAKQWQCYTSVCFRPGGMSDRSNSEPALLFGNIGKVAWGCSSEKTWTLAWCLNLASWQCPCSWHASCPGGFGQKSILKLDHPPYSLDLIPCDFWLFPKLKTALNGQHCRHSGTFDGHPEEHSRRGVTEMVRAVQTPTH
jgi:hypothetical protein